ETNQQSERLVSNVVFSVGCKQRRHDRRADDSESGHRESPSRPIAKSGSGAVAAIDEEPEEGHGREVRSSEFEVRNKFEAKNKATGTTIVAAPGDGRTPVRVSRFDQCSSHSNFEFVSSFDIRISSFSHAGTRIFFTTSSTTPRAVKPEKRACGSITSRWAITA